MTTTLYRGGRIHRPSAEPATALLVDGSQIAWIGAEEVAAGLAARAEQVIDLDGAVVAPGFVDAHVHCLQAGLALLGGPQPEDPAVVSSEQRSAAYRAALSAAARQGIVALHEMSSPLTDTRAGLRELHDIGLHEPVPQVFSYRAELLDAADDARALLQELPFLTGVGGDLDVDGQVELGTAAMRGPYLDVPMLPGVTDAERYGELHLSARQIATHLIACAAAGVQAALRVGGDRGMDELVAGLHLAAATLGPDEEGGAGLRQAHIRVEQALFVDFQALSALLEYGVMPSIQPAACSAFGGADGPWAAKVGVPRAADMSPVADLTTAGLTVAFGSGAPRTPLNPWTAIRAALFHQDESQRLTLHEAFFAHTTAGWRLAAGAAPGAGILAPGHPAHLAIWRAEDYVSQDESLPTWAAQPPLPPLPALQPDGRDPECLRTVRAGVTIHDTLA